MWYLNQIRKLALHHRMFMVGLAGILLVLGVACSDDPTATPTAVPTATTAPTPTTVPFNVTVTDSNGNEVVFDAPPQRIVSYGSAAVEMLFAMGEGNRVVATHDFLTYPPEATELPKVGSAFTINLEKIVELEPDLVYTFFGSSVPDLEASGVPVLYLETPTSLQEIADRTRLWGQITGNPEGAEAVAETFEQKVADLEALVAGVTDEPRLFHDGTLFFTNGPNTLIGKVYRLLKADNIAFDTPDGSYGQLSAEIVVERDPEIIITPFADRLQEILDDPALQGVSAVKNGRVYMVDANLVEVAGPRFVEAVEEVARLIRPELFE